MKKLALISVLILSFVCAWGLLSSDVSITVNGQQFHGPFETLVGGWGLIIATVAIFCAAILMAFVLAGVGLVILGVLALVGVRPVGSRIPVPASGADPVAYCLGLLRGSTAQCIKQLAVSGIPFNKTPVSRPSCSGKHGSVQYQRFQFARCGQIL